MSIPSEPSVRVAALADIHLKNLWDNDVAVAIRQAVDLAEVLLVCGDITDNGRLREFETAAEFFASLDIPIFAVLGNHDRRGFRRVSMKRILREGGVRVLDGDHVVLEASGGASVGLVGICGTGGGFGTSPETHGYSRRFVNAIGVKARRENLRFQMALDALREDETDVQIALMHFAPVVTTLGKEHPMKHWMLGNAMYASTLDAHGVDAVFHGHAHEGVSEGATDSGIPVRNVAVHVTGGVMVYDVLPKQRVIPVHLCPVAPHTVRLLRDEEDAAQHLRM